MQNILLGRLKDVIYFLRSICKKNHPVWREIGFSFEESLQGGFFTSLDIFWMNNKTIVEFGFCIMWRIKNYADLTGCYPSQPLASVDNILLDLRTSKLFIFWLQRRFPDFSYITRAGRLTQHLDCVIIRYAFLSLISWLFMSQTFTLKLRKLKRLQNILQCNIIQ